jgi:hypothetical protein
MSKTTDFNHWLNLYENEDLFAFNSHKDALLWLKIKSITRATILYDFCNLNSIVLKQRTLKGKFEELFILLSHNTENSNNLLNTYFIQKNLDIANNLNTEQLVSELYKLQKFDWGGDYRNSLDKYLVSNYVKAISSFDTLTSKFNTEIQSAVQGYVLNSWYNHWSSIMIEHLFKEHSSVIPTIGQIRRVDFFVNEIPFDLKVTFFPSEFIKARRREKGLPGELAFLKKKAKEYKINYDKIAKESHLTYEIIEKMKDKNSDSCNSALYQLKEQNIEILKEAINNPRTLSKWLYENQGEMRFGSENRLYLVLVDTEDFSNSWKLKRNQDLLSPVITKYLDEFSNKNIRVDFSYKGKTKSFSALADIKFVVK